MRVQRFSEPYHATGSLAAEGVLNQLGRPDIEPLEVLVREAVQNCWDAKRPDERGIRVAIGRARLDFGALDAVTRRLLPNPPPGLPLGDELRPGMEILHFADFGTDGLAGPTRADRDVPGQPRDFIDFVRNIGQPPDKELGGGSFGYGKAAFYIASRARTILVDTLCRVPGGRFERRFIACALGEGFTEDGRPFTGRHWWGRVVDAVPEPLIDEDAAAAAELVGLPGRLGEAGLGTTVAIIAPGIAPDGAATDATMDFIAEALAWNFWPRMTSTPGGAHATMRFELTDEARSVRIPNPRTHEQLRGFVEALDRLRSEPDDDDPLVIDRHIECLRPVRTLGRLILQRGPVAQITLPERAVPQGAQQTAAGVHHVALMRNAELVVKYLRGPEPVTGRIGYSGVFRCSLDVDEAFRRAEPPTHDDWVPRFLPSGHDRTFVKVALERISRTCREAAGYDSATSAADAGADVPLGEFADALATLMPTVDGPGARRAATNGSSSRRRRRNAPGRSAAADVAADVWVDGHASSSSQTEGIDGGGDPLGPSTDRDVLPREVPLGGDRVTQPLRRPQIRSGEEPHPALSEDGAAVIVYPFELRAHGNAVRLTATVEVMTNDGAQVETEAPRGQRLPVVRAWVDPTGTRYTGECVDVPATRTDGRWHVEVPLFDEAMMRLDVTAEAS
jgi:hypothetical protein